MSGSVYWLKSRAISDLVRCKFSCKVKRGGVFNEKLSQIALDLALFIFSLE
jgi:hypothetical protein